MTKTSSPIIIGVDPGLSGAITKLDPINHTIEIFDTPIFEIKNSQKIKKSVDYVQLANILDDERVIQVYLEQVNAMPGNGVSSMFLFGQIFGTVIGTCGGLGLPLTQVRPAVWKHNLKVPADKKAARSRASQLFPNCATAWKRVKDDGRAESALIAFYGMCEMKYRVEKQFTLITNDED